MMHQNQQIVQRAHAEIPLLDLPRGVLRTILEYSAPTNPNERWNWMSRISGTCRVFRVIAENNEALPSELDMEETFVPGGEDPVNYPDRISRNLREPFLRSLRHDPLWRRKNLVKFIVGRGAYEEIETTAGQPVKDSIRDLLVTSQIFPNLKMLCIEAWLGSQLLDARALLHIAQNLPCLRQLMLHVCFSNGAVDITPDLFGSFGETLRQPLHTLLLLFVNWMTDAHMEQFLRRHKYTTHLRSLHLGALGELTDRTANAISRNCRRLEHVSLICSAVTRQGLTSLLRNNGNLNSIDVAYCSQLGPEVVDVLVEHVPYLQTLGANFCEWFDDDCLRRLLRGQLRRSGCVSLSGFISLRNLDIYDTGITPMGLWHAFNKGVDGRIYVGCSREELLDEDNHRRILPLYVSSCLEEWRALAREFTNVHFAKLPLVSRRSVLGEQQGTTSLRRE